MAVPTKTGAVRNTTGGAFTSQTVGSVIAGNNNTSGPATASLSLMEMVPLTYDKSVLPNEQTSGIYTTKKPLSSGTFAYNAAKAGTWIISRISTTLSGVANTKLLFMSRDNLSGKTIHEFKHDFGAKLLTAWVANRFAWTGKLANGTSIKNRRLWMNADGTAAAAPSSLSGVFMFDIADGNATNKAVDDAANPTRSIPGEFIIRNDFVTVNTTGGNFFDYKPVTG